MKRVLEYVQKHQLIIDGDRVVIGLSGGADSVCLLFVLLELQKSLDFSIFAVHINHNLRGQEALRDAAHVENLCKKLQVPFKLVSADVEKVARQKKTGTEEAGRQVRYEAFEQYAKEVGATKIALAHHQNDLAETMAYHLARGTDLAGLAAMRPVRGHYIRPLLCMNRQEIEQYLEKREISYVTDSTNGEDCYTRNRIRHHVIEYLEREVNEQTAAHMSETAQSLGELYDYLQAEAEKLLERYGAVHQEKQIRLEQELFSKPKVLVNYVIRLAVQMLAGRLKDVTREHIGQIYALAEKQVGKEVCLPYGIAAKREYTGICLWIREKADHDKASDGCETGSLCQEEKSSFVLTIPGETVWNGYHILCTLEERNTEEGFIEGGFIEEIPEKMYTKWLNYDKIKSNLVLRFRKTGDYLVIHEQGGKKKLKDFFIDQKIPKEKRDQIPLLCEGQQVLWVCGYRLSEAYKVQKDTKRVLKIQLQGGSDHE